jgi:Carboxypeptidase regulatory-like domain
VQRVPNALVRHLSVILSLVTVGPVSMWAQSSNATISGIVTDQSGAAIPGAEVSLTTTVSGTVTKITTREDGLFAFPNLQQGSYEIKAAAATFRDYVQRGIEVHLNESVRVPITLQIGTAEQTIEVVENASAINYENPEVKGTITRTQIDSLPLQVAGSQRSAAVFVTLLPGVNPGGTGDAFTARFNGGQLWSDEAVMDGVSMVEGLLSQSGMVAIHNDFPISPEAVGEISVLTANFDTQFGASSAAVIIASTKEGTNGFHGGTYEYLRNEDLNARQWGVPRGRKIVRTILARTSAGRSRYQVSGPLERNRFSLSTSKPIAPWARRTRSFLRSPRRQCARAISARGLTQFTIRLPAIW